MFCFRLKKVPILLGLTAIVLWGCTVINHPPLAEFSADPAAGPVPLTVEFDASASSDPDGDPITYWWNFGDGSSGSGVLTTHTYATEGQYAIELVIADSRGEQSTATMSILVTGRVNQPPKASFTAQPPTGGRPLTVFFNAAASSDPDGSIASFLWDFGDGETGSGQTVLHTYSEIGGYLATLTVIDDQNATDSSTVLILVLGGCG